MCLNVCVGEVNVKVRGIKQTNINPRWGLGLFEQTSKVLRNFFSLFLSISLSLYIYMYVFVYVYIYIYIYIEREREREIMS